jgi:hypothetical protein
VFIKRDLFDDVCRAISSRTLLGSSGPSLLGNTRLAVEALRVVCGSLLAAQRT